MSIEHAYQISIAIEEARKIEDKHLRHLVLADKFWKVSALAEKSHKLELAAELDSYGLMSLNQIGKVPETELIRAFRTWVQTNVVRGEDA